MASKRKSRDDFKKFLHAKRQATQVTIIQSPQSQNMVEPQIVIDVVERSEKKQEEEKLDSVKEEEKEVDKESDGEKDAMQADDRDDADSKADQQQPLIERLILLASPDFDMTV